MKANDLPPDLQALLKRAFLHLSDRKLPKADLSQLSEWLEGDGWDDVLTGLVSSYIDSSCLLDDFNDEMMLEHSDIENPKRIKASDRMAYARQHIDYLLSTSMDSVHAIPIIFEHEIQAELCFTMYYHPQGGATFGEFELHHRSEEFLERYASQIITDPRDLSDSQIRHLWKKSEAQLKSWEKRSEDHEG